MDKKANLAALRAATIGKTRVFKKELIDVDGTELEVRQVTIASRGLINNKAMAFTGEDGKPLENPLFDTSKFQIYSVIHMTYIPGTDQKVFTEADYDQLCEQPAGGWFSDLADAAGRLANPDSKEVKKPSEKTDGKG